MAITLLAVAQASSVLRVGVVDLSWDTDGLTYKVLNPGVTNFNGCNVYQDGNLIFSSTSTSQTSYNVAGLSEGTSYTFKVELTSDSVVVRTSNIAAVTTPTFVPDAITLSGTPLANTNFALHERRIDLLWDTAGLTYQYLNPGPTNFNGCRVFQDGNLIFESTSTSQTSYSVTGLDGSTSYNYLVEVTQDGAVIALSSLVSVTTVPYTPMPLTAVASGSSVDLSWDLGDFNSTTYNGRRIYQDGNVIVDGYSYSSQYTVTGLSENTSYNFQMELKQGSTVVAISNIATATTGIELPGKPIDLQGADFQSTEFYLMWTKGVFTDSIEVFMGTTSLGAAGLWGMLITGLSPNINYDFKVRAINTNGFTDSDIFTIKLLTPPQNLVATNPGADFFTLGWDIVPGATFYEAYKNGVLEATSPTNSVLIENLSSSSCNMTVKACNDNAKSIFSTNLFVVVGILENMALAATPDTNSVALAWNTVPLTSPIIGIAAGYGGAVFYNGQVPEQWGDTNSTPPAVVTAPLGTDYYSAGDKHYVAVDSNYNVVAWGDNTYQKATVPGALAANTLVMSFVACGKNHSIASIQSQPSMFAWGDNTYGQCTIPGSVSSTYVNHGSAGDKHTAVVVQGNNFVCWGDNTYGQCSAPSNLVGYAGQVACGSHHTVGSSYNGFVFAWGDNTYGQCDVPPILNQLGTYGLKTVKAGGNFSAALRNDGTLYLWGDNTYGQCDKPVDLPPIAAVECGEDFVVALSTGGYLFAWGRNDHGQTDIPAPNTQVPVTDYHVFQDTASILAIPAPPAASMTAEITGLAPSTSYDFSIKAFDGATATAISNTENVTTLAPAIAAPTGLVASNVKLISFTLSWDSVVGATSYNIYKNEQFAISSNTNSITVSGLTAGNSYEMTVTALAGGEESLHSNMIVVSMNDATLKSYLLGADVGGIVAHTSRVTIHNDTIASTVGTLMSGTTVAGIPVHQSLITGDSNAVGEIDGLMLGENNGIIVHTEVQES